MSYKVKNPKDCFIQIAMHNALQTDIFKIKTLQIVKNLINKIKYHQ